MQDRYAGDVGDFGKIGMLRKMAELDLKIGVNWYLTDKPEENVNADGKHTGYLNDRSFMGCDDKLLEDLGTIIKSDRSVDSLENANLIPNADYYKELLKPGCDNNFIRSKWHKDSLEKLSESDIIFCDPDNGLIVKSVSLKSNKSDKYITPDELVSYYQAGKSIIFYNHRCREKEHIYLRRFDVLKKKNELMEAEWRGLKFARGTTRDYIFILQPKHLKAVDAAINNLMKSKWDRHFSELNI